MKLFYYSWMTVLLTSLINNVQAQASFNGEDFSGVYTCTGEDSHEGQYKGSVSMKLLPQHSTSLAYIPAPVKIAMKGNIKAVSA